MWKKFNSPGDSFETGLGDVTPISPIVFGGVYYIPPLHLVRCPRASGCGCFVHEQFGIG